MQLRKLEKNLRAKEQLAEGLHLIDFEQLKIENQTLGEKIEERNEELQKLRKKNTVTVQVGVVHVCLRCRGCCVHTSEKRMTPSLVGLTTDTHRVLTADHTSRAHARTHPGVDARQGKAAVRGGGQRGRAGQAGEDRWGAGGREGAAEVRQHSQPLKCRSFKCCS